MTKSRKITANEINMLSEYTKEQTATHWTKKYMIKPALLSTAFGDAKKLLFLYPIDDRPNHYLILIDSRMDTSSDEFYDLLDEEIYELLMDEFGCADDDDDDDDDDGFPTFSYGSGMTWGETIIETGEVNNENHIRTDNSQK